MIALIQRVTTAAVTIDHQLCAKIDQGLLALIGIEKNDNQQTANRLLERVLGFRVFPDHEDKMNLSVSAINGGLLLVPQFTLAADTSQGTRAGFSTAASPADANPLFDYFVHKAKTDYAGNVQTGRFGADMQVSLTNNGPVTFWLQVKPQD